jgi:hypothetical protein
MDGNENSVESGNSSPMGTPCSTRKDSKLVKYNLCTKLIMSYIVSNKLIFNHCYREEKAILHGKKIVVPAHHKVPLQYNLLESFLHYWLWEKNNKLQQWN